MRKKLFICSALVGVAFLSVNLAYGEDDVVIDLSVLDSLQTTSAPISTGQVKAQPLFPTVQKKSPEVKKPKLKRIKKEKAKVESAQKTEPKAEKKLSQPQPDSLPKVEDKKTQAITSANKDSINKKTQAECEQEKVEERIIAQPTSEDCQQQDAAKAKLKESNIQESKIPSQPQSAQISNPITPEVVVVKVREQAKEQELKEPQKPISKPLQEKKTAVDMLAPVDLSPKRVAEQKTQSAPLPTVSAPLPTVEDSQKEDNAQLQPIVAEKTGVQGNDLHFAENESELNQEQKQQLDSILSSFKDAPNSKIAIVAYNLDNGKDTFLRKRNSLNRAVNIRSYLLSKGYKNYSIKVINVGDGDARINTVNVSERKK